MQCSLYGCVSGNVNFHAQGDCYVGLAASYGGAAGMQRLMCESSVNDDQLLPHHHHHHNEASTLSDDSVPRACRTIQHSTTSHHHVQQQQQQRPTTYKWMTVKRGPPKTAGRYAHYL